MKQKETKKKSLEAHITKGKDGKLVAVASTEDTDRMGDVLRAGGWKLKNFKKNPVLQFAHNYSVPPVGIAKNIKIKGKKLIFEPVFHEITQLAREVKSMYESTPPIMSAFSVGFVPLKSKPIEKKGQVVGQEILESELLEISAVPVPANASALTIPKSYEPQVKEKVQEWVKDSGGKWVKKEESDEENDEEKEEEKPETESETKSVEETEEKDEGETEEDDKEEIEEKENKDCGCKDDKKEEKVEEAEEDKPEEKEEETEKKEIKEEKEENEQEKEEEEGKEEKEEKVEEEEENEEEEKEEKDGKPENVSEKPYPTEHACRLKDPDKFEDGSFRSTTREHDGKKYRIIMGKLKGEDEMTEQAYRYNKDVWSESSAKSHCQSHDGIRFEPAEEERAIDDKDEIKELEKLDKKVKEMLEQTMKEGRVLSGSNRKKIIDAKEQLQKSISVLDGLLDASEPNNGEGKSQTKGRKRVVRKQLGNRVMVQALQNIAKEVNTTLFHVKNKQNKL